MKINSTQYRDMDLIKKLNLLCSECQTNRAVGFVAAEPHCNNCFRRAHERFVRKWKHI